MSPFLPKIACIATWDYFSPTRLENEKVDCNPGLPASCPKTPHPDMSTFNTMMDGTFKTISISPRVILRHQSDYVSVCRFYIM